MCTAGIDRSRSVAGAMPGIDLVENIAWKSTIERTSRRFPCSSEVINRLGGHSDFVRYLNGRE